METFGFIEGCVVAVVVIVVDGVAVYHINLWVWVRGMIFVFLATGRNGGGSLSVCYGQKRKIARGDSIKIRKKSIEVVGFFRRGMESHNK